ncbi:AAA family ATPase [Nakamurella lactea]|uniref:AAA family ATPase n=1 Tax=Nakamurella lactea TaxID=459515 RepID=UPI00040D9778|nr:AAA family ATPase [Nakamurella lactea]
MSAPQHPIGVGTRPAVVAIGGAPGSGKSTLGRALARELSAALLDQDTMTNPLMAQLATLTGAGDDLDHPSLRGPVRDARYACLRDTALEVSGVGCSVVLIAPFTAERTDAAAWQAFSEPLTAVARPLLVEVVVDPELALTRRSRRGLPRDRQVGAAAASGTPAAAVARVVPAAPSSPSPAADLHADGAADPAAEATRLVELIREFGRSG